MFESAFANYCGTKHCIGVGNGLDALRLILEGYKLIGKLKDGDAVLVASNTYIATILAIKQAGLKPVLVEAEDVTFNFNLKALALAITPDTKAIMPVHWAGRPCEMDKIYSIAKKNNLHVVQDSAHVIGARFKKKHLVNFGDTCTYSMHPLKNLNVWGDGGFIVTNKKALAEKLYLIRNHGLKDRNNVEVFGYNSRLDSIQAAVANYKMKNKLDNITSKRIKNSQLLDKLLSKNNNIITIERLKYLKEVFHLYHINVKNLKTRDLLQKYLIKNNVDAKVHYPIPVHLQRAAKYLKYKKGDFPVSEKLANTSLSLPVHEFIDVRHINHMTKVIFNFFEKQR